MFISSDAVHSRMLRQRISSVDTSGVGSSISQIVEFWFISFLLTSSIGCCPFSVHIIYSC